MTRTGLFPVLLVMLLILDSPATGQIRGRADSLASIASGQVHISLIVPATIQRQDLGPDEAGSVAAINDRTITLDERPVFCLRVPAAGFQVTFANATQDLTLRHGQKANQAQYSPSYRRLPSQRCRGQRGEVRFRQDAGAKGGVAETQLAVLVMVVAPN